MSVRGVCASRGTVAATAARELAVTWRTGWRAVQLNPAAPNAARTSATLGKVSRTAAVSGQNRIRPICRQRPANAERIRTGAPGRSTRANSRAAAGRAGSNGTKVDSHAQSPVAAPSRRAKDTDTQYPPCPDAALLVGAGFSHTP